MDPKVFKLSEPGDWKALGELGADAVLDPVVVRTAHLFLLGRSGTTRPDEVWRSLKGNIGALATFVDAIVLRERIPVFNYGITYDVPGHVSLSEDQRVVWRPEPAELLAVCEEALTAVHIAFKEGPNQYQGEYFDLVAKADAQAREHAPLPSALVREVVSRLEAYDYRWEPREIPANVPTNALTPALQSYREELFGPDTDAGTVRRYLTGCLIFSGFAQKLQGDHVVPPGWSRLYAAAALA